MAGRSLAPQCLRRPGHTNPVASPPPMNSIINQGIILNAVARGRAYPLSVPSFGSPGHHQHAAVKIPPRPHLRHDTTLDPAPTIGRRFLGARSIRLPSLLPPGECMGPPPPRRSLTLVTSLNFVSATIGQPVPLCPPSQ